MQAKPSPEYIIVSGEATSRAGLVPALATGPFEDVAAADRFRDLLARTTDGRHVVLRLHTPMKEEAEDRPMGFAAGITPAERRDVYRTRDEKAYERMPCCCPIDSGCSGYHTGG